MSTLHQVYLTYDIATGKLKEANGLGTDPQAGNITPVVAGDSIQWLLALSNSNIEYISEIVQSAPSQSSPPFVVILFSVEPTQHNNWTGVINPDAPVGDYDYNISFVPISGGGVKTIDPKIKVNIGTGGTP